MSGLIQWSSKAKRKSQKKAAGNKPSSRNQRVAAIRAKRRALAKAKSLNKARKAEIAAAVAEK